ncbi:hypothetical protein [Anaerotignum neopropionicum]|nr:hypothetical protein [Anaerotignum neopropionicum]
MEQRRKCCHHTVMVLRSKIPDPAPKVYRLSEAAVPMDNRL